MAKNMVVGGDYEGFKVAISGGKIVFTKWFETIAITKATVDRYEVLDNDKTSGATGGSKAGRAAIGGVLFGPIGLLAGLGSKGKNDITIVVYFQNGKKSLIECDQNIYKAFMKVFF